MEMANLLYLIIYLYKKFSQRNNLDMSNPHLNLILRLTLIKLKPNLIIKIIL